MSKRVKTALLLPLMYVAADAAILCIFTLFSGLLGGEGKLYFPQDTLSMIVLFALVKLACEAPLVALAIGTQLFRHWIAHIWQLGLIRLTAAVASVVIADYWGLVAYSGTHLLKVIAVVATVAFFGMLLIAALPIVRHVQLSVLEDQAMRGGVRFPEK